MSLGECKKRGLSLCDKPFFAFLNGLFCEVTSQEAIEYTAVTSFVFCHFMNRVMDSVEVELFSEGGDFFLACASALFSSSTHFEVGLGVVGNDFAEEFSEFSSVFSFFESDAFVSFCDFRIAPGGQRHGS